MPEGRDETANVELRRWGDAARRSTSSRRITSRSASGSAAWTSKPPARISGARFVVMRGALARLHRALAQFMLDLHTREHGYTEVYVPYLVAAQSLTGTGQLPKFEQDLFARAAGEQRATT